MKTYNVAKGTGGKLIIQEDNENVRIEDWTVRKFSSFTKTQIIINPEDLNIMKCPYAPNTMAADLIKKGYIVFSVSGKADAKYMLAVQYTDVDIHDE